MGRNKNTSSLKQNKKGDDKKNNSRRTTRIQNKGEDEAAARQRTKENTTHRLTREERALAKAAKAAQAKVQKDKEKKEKKVKDKKDDQKEHKENSPDLPASFSPTPMPVPLEPPDQIQTEPDQPELSELTEPELPEPLPHIESSPPQTESSPTLTLGTTPAPDLTPTIDLPTPLPTPLSTPLLTPLIFNPSPNDLPPLPSILLKRKKTARKERHFRRLLPRRSKLIVGPPTAKITTPELAKPQEAQSANEPKKERQSRRILPLRSKPPLAESKTLLPEPFTIVVPEAPAPLITDPHSGSEQDQIEESPPPLVEKLDRSHMSRKRKREPSPEQTQRKKIKTNNKRPLRKKQGNSILEDQVPTPTPKLSKTNQFLSGYILKIQEQLDAINSSLEGLGNLQLCLLEKAENESRIYESNESFVSCDTDDVSSWSDSLVESSSESIPDL